MFKNGSMDVRRYEHVFEKRNNGDLFWTKPLLIGVKILTASKVLINLQTIICH